MGIGYGPQPTKSKKSAAGPSSANACPPPTKKTKGTTLRTSDHTKYFIFYSGNEPLPLLVGNDKEPIEVSDDNESVKSMVIDEDERDSPSPQHTNEYNEDEESEEEEDSDDEEEEEEADDDNNAAPIPDGTNEISKMLPAAHEVSYKQMMEVLKPTVASAPVLEDDLHITVMHCVQLLEAVTENLELDSFNGDLPDKVTIPLVEAPETWYRCKLTRRVLMVVMARYKDISSFEQAQKDGRVVVDLALAPYYAAQWRAKVAAKVYHGAQDAAVHQDIFNLPFSTHVEWIIRDMRHRTMFEAEAFRHHAFNDPEKKELLLVAENLHYKCCIGESANREKPYPFDKVWEPKDDALFAYDTVMVGNRRVTKPKKFEEQDGWNYLEPRPGFKGDPCDRRGHQDVTNAILSYVPRQFDELDPHQPIADSRVELDTALQDLQACMQDGYPLIYYGPSRAGASLPRKPCLARKSITLAGPGYPQPFPEALTNLVTRATQPGTGLILDTMANKPDLDPCLLPYAPSNFPRAGYEQANQEDIDTMDKGCSQVNPPPPPRFPFPHPALSLTFRDARSLPTSGTEPTTGRQSTSVPSTAASTGTPRTLSCSTWTRAASTRTQSGEGPSSPSTTPCRPSPPAGVATPSATSAPPSAS